MKASEFFKRRQQAQQKYIGKVIPPASRYTDEELMREVKLREESKEKEKIAKHEKCFYNIQGLCPMSVCLYGVPNCPRRINKEKKRKQEQTRFRKKQEIDEFLDDSRDKYNRQELVRGALKEMLRVNNGGQDGKSK